MSETKQCQNCKNEFSIDPEDFVFYEKIQVPPPTWCPECRLVRRLLFNNVLYLYKRACDLCAKVAISRYSVDKKYKIYCPRCWWSDRWDALQYGKKYDFSRPFFEQYNKLWHEVPLLGLSLDLQSAIDSPFTNDAGSLKQCFLLFQAELVERSSYGFLVIKSKDCVNSSFINSCELSYDSFHAFKVYRGIYLIYTTETNNSAFLWQCNNCQSCFGSANLKSKQYYIFNQPHTKEEYNQKINEFDLGSYKNYEAMKARVREHWLAFPVKTFWNEFSQNVTGHLVFESKNCKQCFEVSGVEDSKFVAYIGRGKVTDCYDYTWWGHNAELLYECMTTGSETSRVFFGEETGLGLIDAQYSKLNLGGSYLFGCVSLHNKSYCILNTQYSESQYKELVPKIIRHMNEMPYKDKKGRIYKYGEFFPPELSPFAYNETLGQQYYPLTKKQALETGFSWKDLETNEYATTISANDLPDHIKDATDGLTKEAIACLGCGRAYRIVPQELEFCKNMNVPLSRLCFFCRLQEKLKDQPNPTRFFTRVCQCTGSGSDNGAYPNVAEHSHGKKQCQEEFAATYGPERPEIVYCRACYRSEFI